MYAINDLQLTQATPFIYHVKQQRPLITVLLMISYKILPQIYY